VTCRRSTHFCGFPSDCLHGHSYFILTESENAVEICCSIATEVMLFSGPAVIKSSVWIGKLSCGVSWVTACSMEMRKSLTDSQAGLNFVDTNAHISQKWKVALSPTCCTQPYVLLSPFCLLKFYEKIRSSFFIKYPFLLSSKHLLFNNSAIDWYKGTLRKGQGNLE
jgi:hypothetical protein